MSERRAKQIRRLEARVEVLERKAERVGVLESRLSLGHGFTFDKPQKKKCPLDFLRGLWRKGW